MRIGKYDVSCNFSIINNGFAGLGFWFKNQLFYGGIWELVIYFVFFQINIFSVDTQDPHIPTFR